jgi:hypothetical protein
MSHPTEPPGHEPDEKPGSAIWQWLAIGVLILCWLAEGTLCAQAGP